MTQNGLDMIPTVKVDDQGLHLPGGLSQFLRWWTLPRSARKILAGANSAGNDKEKPSNWRLP